jgi:ATP-dependent exoDNAse (exonuclease V) beta subunit
MSKKIKIKEYNELKRLLYVAVTRAINQLDLVAEINPNNQTIKKNTFLHFLWMTFTPQTLKVLILRGLLIDMKNFHQN